VRDGGAELPEDAEPDLKDAANAAPRPDADPAADPSAGARRSGSGVRMLQAGAGELDALWHDLECGDYSEDLPLWRELADDAGGAGARRRRRHRSRHARPRGARSSVWSRWTSTPHSWMRCDTAPRACPSRPWSPTRAAFASDRRFRCARADADAAAARRTARARGVLRCALDHLEPGALLAAAVADAMDCFDEEHPLSPPPAVRDIVDVRYASRLLAVVEDGGRAAMHWRREIAGPGESYACRDFTLTLDRVSADDVAEQAATVGLLGEPHRFVPETDEYLGSTVVLQRAPRSAN
jgi:hypothetical protein